MERYQERDLQFHPISSWRHDAGHIYGTTPYTRPQQRPVLLASAYGEASKPAQAMQPAVSNIAENDFEGLGKTAPNSWLPSPPLSSGHGVSADSSTSSSPVSSAFIELDVTISARRCTARWNFPCFEKHLKYRYRMEVWQGVQCDKFDLPAHCNQRRFRTVPGLRYKVELLCHDMKGNILAYGKTEFKAVFSRDEMAELHRKAKVFVGKSMHPFYYIYRCKPQYYYDDIHHRLHDLMQCYQKDDNGQAASPINGEINGLFFSARLAPNGELPCQSPFGNVRMIIPAASLLNPMNINMYFSDFYCNYYVHYVTIVVCKNGSETDAFCKARLISLNPDSNPFLRIDVRPPLFIPEYFVNSKVWVEIYYTEDVMLSWGRFDYVNPVGHGTSRIGGLPHNKECEACNLYVDNSRMGTNNKENENNSLSVLETIKDLKRRMVESMRSGDNSGTLKNLDLLVEAIDDVISAHSSNSWESRAAVENKKDGIFEVPIHDSEEKVLKESSQNETEEEKAGPPKAETEECESRSSKEAENEENRSLENETEKDENQQILKDCLQLKDSGDDEELKLSSEIVLKEELKDIDSEHGLDNGTEEGELKEDFETESLLSDEKNDWTLEDLEGISVSSIEF